MFEELEISREKVSKSLVLVEDYLGLLNKKGVREVYMEAVEKIKKELLLFDNNISNIFDNFLKDISSRVGDKEGFLNNDFVDRLDANIIQQYNSNLKERMKSIDLNYMKQGYFEDDIQFYKMIIDSFESVNRLRLDFLKFYREIKSKYKSSSEGMLKIENDFYNYTNEKKKEIEVNFISFENKIKSVVSKYNVTNDDLNDLNKSYLDISEKVKGIYSQLTDINANIFNLNDELNKKISEFDTELKVRADRVEKKINDNTVAVLKDFVKDLDETESLITQEVNSIKKTSRGFKDFISDETSIKLTDDYKSKANFEMTSYYFFNFLSLAIISFAIYFSYSSLSDFATNHIGYYTSLDLAYLGLRLIFSILIFSTIAFTSRLASKSYIYWKKNEGVFLRLTALKSFIADMSEAKKEEIHEKLVDVYFGKDEQEQNLNQKLKDLPNNITQLLGKVVEQTSVVLDASKTTKKDVESATDRSNTN
ncbi:hypothetical protein EC846_0071 [Acinetobacter sp. BIGb0102]|uniref:hypothetical protein n=1 Tax=Acinetobacter sp. BIGb0102 TaxID=2485131 RepID=UPI000F505BCC|nr:hypothetical protein [Acinetobacter sp. BIGb0102]RPE47882.1 hypothetical protein EC846_0071 [Acinetobacter sp. BIGb0102]